MNEQLQNTVNEILQKVIAGATQTGEFLKDQIPDILQQLLTWKLTYAASSAVFYLIFVIAIAVIYKKLWTHTGKLIMEEDRYDALPYWLMRIVGGLVSVIAEVPLLGCVFDNVMAALKIWLAPKVWLLEYAASLVK